MQNPRGDQGIASYQEEAEYHIISASLLEAED